MKYKIHSNACPTDLNPVYANPVAIPNRYRSKKQKTKNSK
jgi:hypothetical protein